MLWRPFAMLAPEVQVRKDSRLFAEICATLLRLGHHVQFRAEGHSMKPNLIDGDSVRVAPADISQLRPGDVTMVENVDGLRVHRVQNISPGHAECITRGDTGLQLDPAAEKIFGKVVSLSRGNRQEQHLNTWRLRVLHPIASAARRIFLAASRRLLDFFRAPTAILFFFVLAGFSATPANAQTADIGLTQTSSATVVAPLTTITYNEVVTNNGPNVAATAVLYQLTPPNTTFASISAPAGWTCATPASGNTGTVTCTDGANLATAAPANFTYIVNVVAGTAAGTTIVNSANVTSLTADNVPQNNATTTTVLVESATGADLSVSMTSSPSPVFISSTLTYTIQVQNLGLVNAANVSVADTIPAGTTFVSATPAISCTQTASVVCTLGTLANGASTTITITVTSPGVSTTLTNTATASTTTTDPVSTNNSSTVITVAQ